MPLTLLCQGLESQSALFECDTFLVGVLCGLGGHAVADDGVEPGYEHCTEGLVGGAEEGVGGAFDARVRLCEVSREFLAESRECILKMCATNLDNLSKLLAPSLHGIPGVSQ